MQLRLKEHWKLVALGLALLVAIAFIVVSVISDSSDAAWPKQKTGGPIVEQGVVDVDLSDPPQQAWELDVRALTDNPGDVLLSMPSTLDSYYGYGNTYQVGDVLVAATAYPLPKTDESSSSQGVGAVTLVGVNPDDGSPLWKTRIGGVIGQCSQQNESTIIACWGDRRMIFVDTATGTLMSDLGTDFDLNGATIAGDTVYTSGERMDGTVRTRILASGTTTNLTANFVRTFEPSEKFGAVYTVPHTDTVIAMEQGDGGDPQYRYRIYDLQSGAERFRFEGDSLVPTGNGLFLTSVGGRSGYAGTQNLLASDGSTIRAIPIPSYSSSSYPSKPSTAVPMFLGDGAYDPESGDELWRSSQIVNTATAGTGSTIAAVVGKTILVTSPETRTISGLDVESGRQLWQTPWQDAYWVRSGATDGDHFVFSDYTGMHSIRARDGKMMWSVPLPPEVDPRGVVVSNAGKNVSFSWQNHFTVWR
jgi:hypothetical protein